MSQRAAGDVDRRRFLSLAGGAGALGLLAACAARDRAVGGATTSPAAVPPAASAPDGGAAPTSAAASTSTSAAAMAASTVGRVLVVVQLGGGNDGLNTLVPLDGRYHDNRPTIALTDDSLLAMPGTSAYGLHPSLASLSALLAAGNVAVLDAIGFAHPNRSHFAALDDWWSATPGQSSTTGWLGRWLDATATTDDDPLRAVALGAGVPALTGAATQPTVVISPEAFAFHQPRRADARLLTELVVAGAGEDPMAAAYRAAIGRAAKAVDRFATLMPVAPIATAGMPITTAGTAGASGEAALAGDITAALATAAQLVTQHAPTRIVHVTVGGFDTHAGQLATQQALLADLAQGVSGFFQQVNAAGHAERVLLMTVSEFGRRVHENGSGGTDHGKAGVQFVVGPSVNGGVYGRADLARLDDGDLASDIDVRSLYTMALDWLGGPVEDIIGRRYDTLGVVRG